LLSGETHSDKWPVTERALKINIDMIYMIELVVWQALEKTMRVGTVHADVHINHL
jgi:hypothetical protein